MKIIDYRHFSRFCSFFRWFYLFYIVFLLKTPYITIQKPTFMLLLCSCYTLFILLLYSCYTVVELCWTVVAHRGTRSLPLLDHKDVLLPVPEFYTETQTRCTQVAQPAAAAFAEVFAKPHLTKHTSYTFLLLQLSETKLSVCQPPRDPRGYGD